MLGPCVAFHHDNKARNTAKVQCPLFVSKIASKRESHLPRQLLPHRLHEHETKRDSDKQLVSEPKRKKIGCVKP